MVLDASEIPLNLKAKGDLAELMVAVDLMRRGHKIAIPMERTAISTWC
jgi:hypothetical protein